MKQVVIVAPHFPPSNLTAGHRCRYFAIHLPKFGWRVKVLSVDPVYYEEELDYELERLLPSDLEIIRTRAISTHPFRLVGDIGIRAFWWHYRALCRLITKEKIDLIYISIPSNYSVMLGPLIYRKFSIPYAIDYQDPWVHKFPGYDVLFSKAWLSYHLSRFLEPKALKYVSLITGVAPGYYEGALERSPWLDSSKCVDMPLGGEEMEYKYLDEHPRPPYLYDPADGKKHIVYAGGMIPKFYDTLEAIFKAICLLRRKNPQILSNLKIHFIGTGRVVTDPTTYTVKPWIDKFGLNGIINEYPKRIPYLDVLNHLKYSYAVLVIGSSTPFYTPSKVFQVILSRRPVIALLHSHSSAAKILKESNLGYLLTFDDNHPVLTKVAQIAQMLFNLITNCKYSDKKVNWNTFRNYSVEAVTKKLADAFDEILEMTK